MKKKEILNLLEWSFVFFVAFFMCIYGAGKFLQFGDVSYYSKPLSSYNGMQLMWAFYSYSRVYAIIIGLFEIAGALLLLLPKTRIIGCLVLTSILINIILQDYFYDVLKGAMLNAVFYQILILGILWMNREKVLLMVKSSFIEFHFSKKKLALKILIIIIFLLLLYFTLSAITFLLDR